MSLLPLLSTGEQTSPNKIALSFVDDAGESTNWTYGELFGEVHRLSAGLANLGLHKGDRIAFYLGNGPEFVLAYLAVIELGAIMVPVNLAYRRLEIANILTDAKPRFVLTDRERLDHLNETAAEDRTSVERILKSEDLASLGSDDPQEVPGPPVDGEDTALIMYTSGTTGRSKGAVLSHNNVAATVRGLLEAWAWSADDTLTLTLPMFHTHGLIVGLHCALAAGATVRLHRRFDAGRVADELSGGNEHPGPTLFFGVPAMYGRLIKEFERQGVPSSLTNMRLFCSGSAPLDPETFRVFERLTGHPILERYGMTETGMLLSNPYDGERLPGTVGTPLPGVSAQVADNLGQPLSDGEEGELLVRGANVFDGYWRAAEKTAASFSTDVDGKSWFHTGDLAARDPQTGHYTLLGRRHELILSGGFNIYPREIEEVLTTHPAVREAAVIGRPHSEWGETPMAYLVVDEPVDTEALIAHCREQIASFKVPRHFVIIEALPRNALGKVQKHLLPKETT
jgi:malonyl-CoA/methylmalonyl-CoA synthetase